MSGQQSTSWPASASVILAARNGIDDSYDNYNYKLLMIKRSERTALFENQAVFPGGMFDAFDESVQWLEYFEAFGVTQQQLKELVIISDNRPAILAPQGNGCYDRFFKRSSIWAREISLRITAIRETFEEVGVLLCRNKHELHMNEGFTFVKDGFDKHYWQQLVHNDPKEFLRLCQELQVVPDLWSLYEWSAWASPATVKKRVETAFFIAILNEKPPTLIEVTEVKECIWQPPTFLLQMQQDGELFFLPPQIYEISRFVTVKDLFDLKEFAKQRSKKGVTLFLPVPYLCSDGMVVTYPGDDKYAEDPRSATKYIRTNLSTSEFRANTKRLHRFEHFGTTEGNIVLNFQPQNGHLAPTLTVTASNKL
ncbi:nucleoside diphosphate-linked moiety X motif 19 [Teleopsis dalmanni]|uniref:nucleoside diphosphate-linked moiety X motif 19 n=1 Tax=Teleopsis dalmanni TaxID=139649 RepID=UPI0018CF1E59|nr:nucleoside diphosphate-linked moiety X motif 19 [Teleopsis dalmanni]